MVTMDAAELHGVSRESVIVEELKYRLRFSPALTVVVSTTTVLQLALLAHLFKVVLASLQRFAAACKDC